MKNVIAYVAQKNKTVAHSMSLNNRISCVVGISIFGFKTFWKQKDLMEIQKSSTFEQFLQAETLNAKKNKSYYQRYDGKQLRAFHKQAMTKQQIYDNIPSRRSEVDYSQGMQFQTSLVNMEETKELTMNNQQKRCRCGSIKHLLISSNDCPVGLAIRKAKKPSNIHSLVPSSETYMNPTSTPSSSFLSIEPSSVPSSLPSYSPSISNQPSSCTVCSKTASP